MSTSHTRLECVVALKINFIPPVNAEYYDASGLCSTTFDYSFVEAYYVGSQKD